MHKVIFEIDPSDGSILTPSTKIATFDNTGSQTGIGKNSVAVAPYFQDPNDPWGPPLGVFNLMYLTGMDMSLQPTNAMFESHGVYDNGSTFNSYVNSSLPAQQLIPGNPGQPAINSWLLDADYSDQTTYQDYRYMVGRDYGNYYTGYGTQMFVIKHHNGLNANISVEFVDGTRYGQHEDVPTRTINDPAHGIMTVFGGAIHDGASYVNDPVRMDPGMWWVDHNMNTTVHKTYHNASGIANENFGVAQSHIVVNQGVTNGSGQTLQFSLIVSSGNNPQSASSSTDQFQMGRWNKNHFHLLRDWDYAGMATEALRLSFVNNPDPLDPHLGTFYTDVQVGDIVEVEDGYLIVGTVIWSERYETTDDDGLPILGVLDMDKIFMIKLDKPANMFNNPTLAYAKFFNGLPVNPKDIDEVQANRVKVIGDDVFIIGSYSSTTTPNQRTPILIKTDIDNQLQYECTTPLDVKIEELDVYEVNAQEGENSANPYYNPDYHFYGIQRVAPSTVVCTPPPPPTPEDIASIGLIGDLERSVSLFPNPANGQITISGMTQGDAVIVIVDVKGQRVLEYSGAVSENHTLSVSGLDKGVYFLQITQNEQMQSIKLIKD